MSTGDSPSVARRRVRLAIREAREARQLTQSDVAEAMEWSLSKVIRIEGGEVTIAPNDLRPLLAYLGVKNREVVNDLLANAKASRVRQRPWWKQEKYRAHLTPALQQLIEFEAEAVAIRYFYIFLVPGPLQIAEYAAAILHKWQYEMAEDDIAVRLEARMKRREALLNRTDPPKISVLLDQSVLERPEGGEQVLAAQLADLLSLMERGRVHVRVVPYSADAPVPRASSFYDALYLSEEGNDADAVLYRELDVDDEIVEDVGKAALYRTRFEMLWNASLDEEATSQLIRQRLKILGHPVES